MRAPGRWARAEWGLLYVTVREPLLKRRLRAVPMTVGVVCLTALLQYVQNQPWGFGFVQDMGAVRAQDPLWQALSRTPLSLFVPALDLPVWGALAQILLVFGIAELCLGRWRTLAVAYAATLAGTLYARLGIALGAHVPFGLPWTDGQVVDTGPSAAVVGLAVFVSWRYGAYATVGAVTLAMVVEVLLKPNLAGKEHLAALTAVGLLSLPTASRHTPAPARPAAPAVSSGRAGAPGGDQACRRSSPERHGPAPPSNSRAGRRAGRPWHGRGGGGRRTGGPTGSRGRRAGSRRRARPAARSPRRARCGPFPCTGRRGRGGSSRRCWKSMTRVTTKVSTKAARASSSGSLPGSTMFRTHQCPMCALYSALGKRRARLWKGRACGRGHRGLPSGGSRAAG
jgi:hypothetical protein